MTTQSTNTTLATNTPLVGIVMGSTSDWPAMREAADALHELRIPFEKRIVSAHRTPQRLYQYGKSARQRGLKIIIAGAGGAAHLPGMLAALTPVPVLGVPMRSETLSGLDSLLSIAQMPRGVAVGTMAIGPAGAYNAALLAASMLANYDAQLAQCLDALRADTAANVPLQPEPE